MLSLAHENSYILPRPCLHHFSYEPALAGGEYNQLLLLLLQMFETESVVLPYPLDEYRNLRVGIIATWAIALTTVCLRYLTRRLSNVGLWYDDWLMIPATVSISQMTISSTTPLAQGDNLSS